LRHKKYPPVTTSGHRPRPFLKRDMGFDSSLVHLEFTEGGFSIEVHTVLYGEPTHHHQYRRRDSGSMQRISPRDDGLPATDLRQSLHLVRSRKPTNQPPTQTASLQQVVRPSHRSPAPTLSSFERATLDHSSPQPQLHARATAVASPDPHFAESRPPSPRGIVCPRNRERRRRP
jgi:hypothetical protein